MAAVDSIETVPSARLILGFGFLYERLVDILDGQGTVVSEVVVEPEQSGLDTAVGPLVANPAVVRAHRPTMARLRERLAPFAAGRPGQADIEFRQRLVELRAALEKVYGQRLTFGGERREPTGTRVEVSQEADTVRGLAVGVDIESGWTDGDVKVIQNVRVVEERGTAIGARLGGDLRRD